VRQGLAKASGRPAWSSWGVDYGHHVEMCILAGCWYRRRTCGDGGWVCSGDCDPEHGDVSPGRGLGVFTRPDHGMVGRRSQVGIAHHGPSAGLFASTQFVVVAVQHAADMSVDGGCESAICGRGSHACLGVFVLRRCGRLNAVPDRGAARSIGSVL